ncbi:MAG: DEAD/DEAH box helicase, partial [Devosia sp.]
VIHADLPTKPDTLLHRSGRTGRAGRKGVCILVAPVHRRGAAQRVLKLANIEATTRSAPTIAEIEARNRQQILAAAIDAPQPDEAERAFVAELLARVSPEQLAAAYLRQQLAANPAPEELSETPVAAYVERAPRREDGSGEGASESAQRPPRQPDMVDGVWFMLSLGRKHRADPKWLLPMICKAGGVTKRDVGSIKILDTETRFEIASDKAAAFAEQITRTGSGEKGVNIVPSSNPPPYRRPAGNASTYDPAAEAKVRPAPPRDTAPHYKVRSDKGEKLGTEPAHVATGQPPRPPFNPKDKGKPKYKGKRSAGHPKQAQG